MKKALNAIYITVIFFLVSVSILVVLTSYHLIPGYRLYTVQSGSMEPKLKTGSLILIQPKDNYEVGDIVTYKTESEIDSPNPKNTVTHRIVEKKAEQDNNIYTTKGDANNTADPSPIAQEQILGTLFIAIPLIGRIVSFARTQTGLIILIIIPTTIIIFSELQVIKKEIVKLLQQKNRKK